jgi:dephospho-CoA kinase
VLLVGLTGGIGAGKSTVAGLLAKRGAAIVDADTIAREVVEPGTSSFAQLLARFGSGVVLPDGAGLDRPALAALVFADPSALRDLNAITHPAIRLQMAEAASAYAGTDTVVVLDIPLLKEETRDQFGIAGVIVVDVPVEIGRAHV